MCPEFSPVIIAFLTLGSVKTSPLSIPTQLRNRRPEPESSGGGSSGLVWSTSLHQVGQECLRDKNVWGKKFLAVELLAGALLAQQGELVNYISYHHDRSVPHFTFMLQHSQNSSTNLAVAKNNVPKVSMHAKLH